MRRTALLALALSVLSPVGGTDRIDFSKAGRTPSESTSIFNETESTQLSDLSLSDIGEIVKMRESRFYPFVANVQSSPAGEPRFSRINNPLYLRTIAVVALVRNQKGKTVRHEITDLETQQLVGRYEVKMNFSTSTVGKEYNPKDLDVLNRNYEVRWTLGEQKPYKELGRLLFGKSGTRMLVR